MEGINASRKNGGYRGTSKMVVPLDSVIQLKHPRGLPSDEGVHFDVSFPKLRGLRCADTKDFTAKLEACSNGERRWIVGVSTDAMVSVVVEVNRSLDYASNAAIAKKLGIDRSTVGRYRDKAIAAQLITRQQREANETMAANPEHQAPEDFSPAAIAELVGGVELADAPF
jgi:hypothetical protein